MGWKLKLAAFCFGTLALAASAPSWRDKPPADWSEEDAKQVLTNSPWVKYVTPEQVHSLSPSARRDSGDWDADIGQGVGLAGTGILGPRRAAEAIKAAHEAPEFAPLAIRWESALPVRLAERKTGEMDLPVLDSDEYAISIFNVELPNHHNLAHELKGLALLRRAGKKDARPSHVQIMRHDDGAATLTYFFPRSMEITRRDGTIVFAAQIGRLFLHQDFDTPRMQLLGASQLLMPSK